jgi:anti-sigma B factor antagonist
MDIAPRGRKQGSWSVVEVTGELDLSNVPELEALLTEHLRTDPHVAIDLSRVTFMDSSALGALVGALKRAREHDGDVILVGAAGAPRRVLEITGLEKAFTLVASLGDLPAA